MKKMGEVTIDDQIREAKKRLNALILLVAFTGILLIATTYAWFSTQRNVTLSGLTGVVNVAEGLQISLDAEKWANEIDLSNLAENYFGEDSEYNLETPWEGHTNLIPNELLPASTTGQTNEGIGLEDLRMHRGVVEGSTLSNIEPITVGGEEEAGYYAIDFFLQNSSASSVVTDLLQLQTNSTIALSSSSRYSTGLQNTLRVAFAIYDEDTAKAQDTVVGSATATPENIRAATVGTGRKITSLAIWEPNASGEEVTNTESGSPVVETYAAHVDYIVTNNNNLTLSVADRGKFPLASGTSVFAEGEAVPTYALTTASDSKTIEDIYNWDDEAAGNGLVRQYTLQTPNTGVEANVEGETAVQLVSAEDGSTAITIAPGKYIHMKMYVWLEGQDVDCTNYASLGGNVTIQVGLSKPGGDNTPEEEPIDINTEYVGYYADVDGNDTVDGVIYADLAVGKSGTWGEGFDDPYSYSTETGLKEYYISQASYSGDFGTKPVIKEIEGSTGKDRFYVMALDDVNDENGPYYTWYDSAYDDGGQMTDYATTTSEDFGAGKTNTETMIAKWNASDYGPQDDNGTYKDMWGVIQEQVEDGWFVPSMREWLAFGDNLDITSDNYVNYNLSAFCWSSSQFNANGAWYVGFDYGYVNYYDVNNYNYVLLSATF